MIRSLISGRYAHTADVVNSKIYVIGGNKQGTPLKEVEVFDISSNTWTPLSYSGTFHERFYHCASIVNDRIYLIGGEAYSNDTVSEVDVFDPASTSWSTLAATGSYTPRSEFSANIIDGKIYIIGGRTSNLELVESIEALDIASTTWIKLETSGPFISRYRHTAEVVDGKIYVIGGSTDTVNVFDPATNTWSIVETTGKFTKRTSLASAVVDGKIYAIGGHAPGAGELNTNEVFTPTKSDVDISEVNLSAISIFPNPSSDLVRITGLPDDTQTLRITDILGNPVLDVLNLQHTDVIVNVSKLSAGIYYIRIVSPGKATISKFVVQ